MKELESQLRSSWKSWTAEMTYWKRNWTKKPWLLQPARRLSRGVAEDKKDAESRLLNSRKNWKNLKRRILNKQVMAYILYGQEVLPSVHFYYKQVLWLLWHIRNRAVQSTISFLLFTYLLNIAAMHGQICEYLNLPALYNSMLIHFGLCTSSLCILH